MEAGVLPSDDVADDAVQLESAFRILDRLISPVDDRPEELVTHRHPVADREVAVVEVQVGSADGGGVHLDDDRPLAARFFDPRLL